MLIPTSGDVPSVAGVLGQRLCPGSGRTRADQNPGTGRRGLQQVTAGDSAPVRLGRAVLVGVTHLNSLPFLTRVIASWPV